MADPPEVALTNGENESEAGYLGLQENATNGTADASQAPYDDILKSLWMQIIFIFFYAVIFILGVTGNSIVIYIVVRNKSMQTITNVFIANLAVSDVMMCLLAVPFTPISAFVNNWIFGEFLCHLVPMTLMVSVYVSTLTSTAIAVDRYFVIVHPFKPRMKTKVCLALIVAIWLVAISISLPLGIYQKIGYEPTDDTYACTEHWPKETARQFFTVTSLILQYIVPCSIICYCYIDVSIVLTNRSRARVGTGSRSRDRDEIEIRRKRRTNRMLVAMISIFVVCWLPLNINHIITEYNQQYHNWHFYYLIFFTSHVIAMSSTVYNPFLYAWMNDNFRKEFKLVLPFIFRRSTTKYDNGQSTVLTTADPQSMHNTRLLEKNGPTEISTCADNRDDVELRPLRPEDD